jgi:Flp pilus assembly pilin Flp
MDLSIFKTWVMARLPIDSERAATMVEYVLILVLIAIVVIAIVTAFGKSVSGKFSQPSSGVG